MDRRSTISVNLNGIPFPWSSVKYLSHYGPHPLSRYNYGLLRSYFDVIVCTSIHTLLNNIYKKNKSGYLSVKVTDYVYENREENFK